MRRCSSILILAMLFMFGGCRMMTSISDGIERSINSASEDYKHVTTGSNSTYIRDQRSQN